MSSQKPSRNIRLSALRALKPQGEKFSMMTAYDASLAYWASQAGIEALLVGDSLGMVLQGKETTLSVTVEEIEYHTHAVAMGNQGSFILADMPFMAAATSSLALDNSARFIRAGAHMVKIEGGAWLAESVRLLAERGIPVCAHLGLTLQFIHKLSGYKIQGRDELSAQLLLEAAAVLEEAGADILLLECVPSSLAKKITQKVKIPVVGIGAGPDTDAQVLVVHDVLGITVGRTPKFSKNYLKETGSIQAAFERYRHEVKTGIFPAKEHEFDL